MKSGLSFLIAARRSEVDELDRLARTGELVGAVGRLVHALQRERGLGNVFLASAGARFGPQRVAQAAVCNRFEQDVRAGFDRLETEGRGFGNATRLFSRVAWVLPGLDGLPALRRRVAAREIGAAEATAAFNKLIGGLLGVVFEAADGATDPAVSRLLAALFNFMQGKEYAGQERACGAAAFAAGSAEADRQAQWLQLIAAQERCFEVFADFAGPDLAALWLHSQPAAELAGLERLRRIGCAAPAGGVLDPALSTAWFDGCSLRIDAMQQVEERLCADLRALCERQIVAARTDADAHEALLARLAPDAEDTGAFFFDRPAVPGPAPAAFGHRLERAVLDMLQEQTSRLQAVRDELDRVRAGLDERKLVERAKGLLMAHRRITEPQAHQLLRQTAMSQSRRLVEVAESVLSMADYLPAGD